MGIRIGVGGILINAGGGAQAPWNYTDGLALAYTSRSGMDLLETQSGDDRNAKILPSAGHCDASNYLTRAQNGYGGSMASGYVEFRIHHDGTTQRRTIFATSDDAFETRQFCLYLYLNHFYLYVRNAVSGVNNLIWAGTIGAGWFTVRWESDGSAYKCYINGVDTALTVSAGSNNGVWINSPSAYTDSITIGWVRTSSPEYSTTFPIDYVDVNGANKWIITGEGKYVYDIIGTAHMTWTGSGHIAYDVDAGSSLLTGGYSIWTKAGEANEYVPYKGGAPYDVSAHLAGYSKLADFAGSATEYNYAPALVDFDYTDTADASLDSFNKANTDHFVGGSPSPFAYYDAANTYRWRQDELQAPSIYSDDYKNVGYKGYWMIKGEVGSGVVKTLEALLVYSADNIGEDMWYLAHYCGLDDLYVLSGGQPVYDGDGYLTWL